MEDVEAFLCENSTIHELYLGHNFITDTGLAKIGLGLQENEALEILDLSNNRIKGESSQFSFLLYTVQNAHVITSNTILFSRSCYVFAICIE